MVAERRLSVVQLPGGRGDRPVAADRVEHAELKEADHS
jgi:hypothetical protein